jgi:hypothetical protein
LLLCVEFLAFFTGQKPLQIFAIDLHLRRDIESLNFPSRIASKRVRDADSTDKIMCFNDAAPQKPRSFWFVRVHER